MEKDTAVKLHICHHSVTPRKSTYDWNLGGGWTTDKEARTMKVMKAGVS